MKDERNLFCWICRTVHPPCSMDGCNARTRCPSDEPGHPWSHCDACDLGCTPAFYGAEIYNGRGEVVAVRNQHGECVKRECVRTQGTSVDRLANDGCATLGGWQEPTCDWCGQNPRGHLFRYYVERDGINTRPEPIDGLFCSIDCARSYHS